MLTVLYLTVENILSRYNIIELRSVTVNMSWLIDYIKLLLKSLVDISDVFLYLILCNLCIGLGISIVKGIII